MQDLKILALQTNLIWENPDRNLSEIEKRIAENFDNHDLIVLPETFTTGFPVDPHKFSETIDGNTIKWMKRLSVKYDSVITGTLLLNDNNQFTNSLIWMCPDGNYKQYSKRHVFSMGGEHEKITAGQEKLVVELLGWKIRPMICYDLRFPVWSKNNYDDDKGFEYDLAIYVANWPAVRSYPWKSLLVARAIENQSYVIGVNRIGSDGLKNSYSGDSMIIDAKGSILALGEENIDTAISVTLSYNNLEKFRKTFNVGYDWDNFTIH